MIRRPVVAGRRLTVTADTADQYFGTLDDDQHWCDNVLDTLLHLVRPDDVVIEVGANIGLHTLALANATPSGRIYAFEPAGRTVGYLQDNVAANGVQNVTVIHSAVSAASGTIEFYVNREFAAGSLVVEHASAVLRAHLDTRASADGPQPADPLTTPWGDLETVPAITVDEFAQNMERLDVIKIDTEGHDMQVLRGAANTLDRLRPTVLMEFSSFALTLHDSTLPADALTTIRNTFDHIFVIEPDGSHWRVASDTDAWKLLYANATVRPVHDLLCLFDGSPALDRMEVWRRPAPSEPDRASEPAAAAPVPLHETAEAETEHDAVHQELRAAKATIDQLQGELEAVRHTVSWRLTEPLRKLRTRIR
jgi:FkbM family methyltransferase